MDIKLFWNKVKPYLIRLWVYRPRKIARPMSKFPVK